MDYSKLEELTRLWKAGALTDAEFEAEKQKILNAGPDSLHTSRDGGLPFGLTESLCLALMNFLILIPTIGWICPIVFWLMGKDYSEKIDAQGRYIINWYLTWAILTCVLVVAALIVTFTIILAVPFIFVVVGVAAVVSIVFVVFPIIGGVKGLDGETWKYPCSIPFFNQK
jgi:uncharacterized Tic20 family protein